MSHEAPFRAAPMDMAGWYHIRGAQANHHGGSFPPTPHTGGELVGDGRLRDLPPERLRERTAPRGIAGHEGRHEGRTDDRSRRRTCLPPGLLGRARSRRRRAVAGRCADGRPPPPPGPSPGARPGHPSRRRSPRNRRIRAKRTRSPRTARGAVPGAASRTTSIPRAAPIAAKRSASSTGRSGTIAPVTPDPARSSQNDSYPRWCTMLA